MFERNAKGSFFDFKEGQRSPICFRSLLSFLEEGGEGAGGDGGQTKTGKEKKKEKRGQTVKRVQSIFPSVSRYSWRASVDYDTI